MISKDGYVYIKECEEEYKKLCGIESFPEYEIREKNMRCGANRDQDEQFVVAYYDTKTGKHLLEIAEELYRNMYGIQQVFHEFTHMLDDEMFSNRSSIKHFSNYGFTEYHAAQIEFLTVLGATTVEDCIAFSIDDEIEMAHGAEMVEDYINDPLKFAVEMINRPDFPADAKALKSALDLIFNYYGRGSICIMYSCDYNYNGKENHTGIEKIITQEMVEFLDTYMTGWFDRDKVEELGEVYYQMAMSLVKQYGLG